MEKLWFTYILLCEKDKYYIGVTNDLTKRLNQHKGLIVGGAKYTKANKPIDFVYIEPHINKSICQKREYILKQKTKKQKAKLIEDCIYLNLKDKNEY